LKRIEKVKKIHCSRNSGGGGGAHLTKIFEEIIDKEENVNNSNICLNVWKLLSKQLNPVGDISEVGT
jgi:hypothetical protein